MQGTLALLVLLMMGATLMGLVRPSLVLPARRKPSRLKAAGIYGVLTFAGMLVLGSATCTPEERARLAAAAEVEAERRAADRAEEAAMAPLRKVERANSHVERVERAGPFVNIWLKPVESFTDKHWLLSLSFVLGDVWPAVRDAVPEAEAVRVIVQADFADQYGNLKREIAVQLGVPMAELRKIQFEQVVGPPLLNFTNIEKLRFGVKDEVSDFCGDADLGRQSDRFCEAALPRFRG